MNFVSKETINIYSDGACSGNPGPGGWGAVMRFGTHEKELSGFSPCTTNNRMELLAAIRALEAVKTRKYKILITTDSTYLKNGITVWIHNWKRSGWRKSDKKAVENSDLWKRLDELVSSYRTEWEWVRGHTGHPENTKADELAVLAIKKGLAGEIPEDELGRKPGGKCGLPS